MRRNFLIVAAICLGLQILGGIISIAFSMPAQVAFGGDLTNPTHATPVLVAKELLSKGTALAPPLILTVVYSILLFFAQKKGALGVIGTVLLSIVGILFTFATMGEYVNPNRFPHMPGPLFLANLLINNVFTIGIAILGITTIIKHFLQKNKSINF
jgi:hypothetical protein